MNNLDQLRKKYKKFVYKSFEWSVEGNQLNTSFHYEIAPDLIFTHTILFENLDQIDKISSKNIDQFVFHLGISEIPSYWKSTAAQTIEIAAGHLNSDQITWWHNLFINGMGEFFFKNQIDFTGSHFLEIISTGPVHENPSFTPTATNSVLIPIGGGKDSIVTLEILKDKFPTAPFVVYPTTPASMAITDLSGFKKFPSASRILDPLMTNLDRFTFLTGHIPYSATLSFIFLLAAVIDGHKYIAVSNERSSLEANVSYLGWDINHQYSKTLEYETSFNDYIYKHLTKNTTYFSFLRPLFELQIAKIFAHMPKYFPIFRSCNKGQQTNSWCNKCPKCLSIALTLIPWLGEEKIISFMGKNPLSDPDNTHLLNQMTDPNEIKPFECVTTTEEAQICLELISKGRTKTINQFLTHWIPDLNMPKEFETILREAYESS